MQKMPGVLLMDDNLSVNRLESDLIYSIRQFHRYANLHPIDRANAVIKVLDMILEEAHKIQTQESKVGVFDE